MKSDFYFVVGKDPYWGWVFVHENVKTTESCALARTSKDWAVKFHRKELAEKWAAKNAPAWLPLHVFNEADLPKSIY